MAEQARDYRMPNLHETQMASARQVDNLSGWDKIQSEVDWDSVQLAGNSMSHAIVLLLLADKYFVWFVQEWDRVAKTHGMFQLMSQARRTAAVSDRMAGTMDRLYRLVLDLSNGAKSDTSGLGSDQLDLEEVYKCFNVDASVMKHDEVLQYYHTRGLPIQSFDVQPMAPLQWLVNEKEWTHLPWNLVVCNKKGMGNFEGTNWLTIGPTSDNGQVGFYGPVAAIVIANARFNGVTRQVHQFYEPKGKKLKQPLDVQTQGSVLESSTIVAYLLERVY